MQVLFDKALGECRERRRPPQAAPVRHARNSGAHRTDVFGFSLGSISSILSSFEASGKPGAVHLRSFAAVIGSLDELNQSAAYAAIARSGS
jgi:hypothetical protein